MGKFWYFKKDETIENTEPVSGVETRQSSGSVVTTFGGMICEEGDQFDSKRPDPSKKLCAAGNKKISDRLYPQKLTKEIHDIAIAVGETKLAARLGLDVRAAELFYHQPCMRDLKNEYNRVIKLNAESNDDSIKEDPLANFAALETLRYHILESPLNYFSCSELETVYIDKLNAFGSGTSSFVSEFLEKHADYLGISIIQKSWNTPYQVLRKSTLKVSLGTSDWCDLLKY